MTLIRVLVSHDGDDGVRKKGDIYDCASALATTKITAGVAEALSSPDQATYKGADREGAATTATAAVATARAAVAEAQDDFDDAREALETAKAGLHTALNAERAAIRAAATDDDTPPAGQAVNILGTTYSKATTASAVAVDITGAEIGSTYALSITSSGGGTAVTRTGTVAADTTHLTGIDCHNLNAGTMTASLVLTDPSGNAASAVTDTATLTS